jgi:hypothetical protein
LLRKLHKRRGKQRKQKLSENGSRMQRRQKDSGKPKKQRKRNERQRKKGENMLLPVGVELEDAELGDVGLVEVLELVDVELVDLSNRTYR